MLKKLSLLSITFFICISVFATNDTIRVLAIGNSFSEDAVENNLYDLGKADGITFIIGNMLIGGCSLEKHWNNASNDLAVYSYRKIESDGIKTVVGNAKLSEVIPSESWDYISFQQLSSDVGIYTTYFPYLPNLYDYVKMQVTNPSVKYMLHMTWAYAQNSAHAGFVKYDKDQDKMYKAIVPTVDSVAKTVGIGIVIPSGTAIQNARATILGDTLCRDGYHLNLVIGRYIAACTWYEKITGRSVVGNRFAPASMTSEEVLIAQRSAHNAVLYSNGISK